MLNIILSRTCNRRDKTHGVVSCILDCLGGRGIENVRGNSNLMLGRCTFLHLITRGFEACVYISPRRADVTCCINQCFHIREAAPGGRAKSWPGEGTAGGESSGC